MHHYTVFYPGTFWGEVSTQTSKLPPRIFGHACREAENNGFFEISIFNYRDGKQGRTASSCQISSKSVMPRPKYGYFQIFKDGGRRHLGFSNFKIFNGRTVKVGELHQRAKFRENRSNRSQNIAIFRFFKMAAAAILDC